MGVNRGKNIRKAELLQIYKTGRYMPGSLLGLDITGEDVEETDLVWAQGDADRICFPIPGRLRRVVCAEPDFVGSAALRGLAASGRGRCAAASPPC